MFVLLPLVALFYRSSDRIQKTHLAKILQILFPLLPSGWSLFSVGRPVEKLHLAENFPGAIFLYNFLGKNSFIEKLRKTLFLEKNFLKTPLIRLCICHSKPLKILHLVFIPLIFFRSFFRLLFFTQRNFPFTFLVGRSIFRVAVKSAYSFFS